MCICGKVVFVVCICGEVVFVVCICCEPVSEIKCMGAEIKETDHVTGLLISRVVCYLTKDSRKWHALYRRTQHGTDYIFYMNAHAAYDKSLQSD